MDGRIPRKPEHIDGNHNPDYVIPMDRTTLNQQIEHSYLKYLIENGD